MKEARQQAGGFLCPDTETCLRFAYLAVIWLFKISILGNKWEGIPWGKGLPIHTWLTPNHGAGHFITEQRQTLVDSSREPKHAVSAVHSLAIFRLSKAQLPVFTDTMSLFSHSLLCTSCAKLLPVPLSACDTILDVHFNSPLTLEHLNTLQTAVLGWTKKIPVYPSILLLVMTAEHKGRVDSENSLLFCSIFQASAPQRLPKTETVSLHLLVWDGFLFHWLV